MLERHAPSEIRRARVSRGRDECITLVSARVSRAGERVLAIANFHCSFPPSTKFKGKTVSARRLNQHARRARYPCDGRLSILYLDGALCARELGGHYANDNCCSKNENRPGGRRGFSPTSRY